MSGFSFTQPRISSFHSHHSFKNNFALFLCVQILPPLIGPGLMWMPGHFTTLDRSQVLTNKKV